MLLNYNQHTFGNVLQFYANVDKGTENKIHPPPPRFLICFESLDFALHTCNK